MLDDVTVFCPRIRFKRATRQGLVWVTEAMFPGYLFARFELAQMHRQVRYAHGVAGIVQFGGRYSTIEDETFAQLRDRTGLAEVKEFKYELAQGDQVKIAGHFFIGLEAVPLENGSRSRALQRFAAVDPPTCGVRLSAGSEVKDRGDCGF